MWVGGLVVLLSGGLVVWQFGGLVDSQSTSESYIQPNNQTTKQQKTHKTISDKQYISVNI